MYPLQWHWPCIFMATEVASRIMDYHVTVHILHVPHFTLNVTFTHGIVNNLIEMHYKITKTIPWAHNDSGSTLPKISFPQSD